MEEFPPRPTRQQGEEMVRRRRGRNIAMLVVLLALCVLFFAITLVKMSAHG
jgi:hypothetical protein